MPYSRNLKRYTFSLNQGTQLILELFKNACDQYFKTRGTEQKVITDLAIGEKQLKKGLMAKLISTVENISEKKYGANFVTLAQIDNIKLDPEADNILEDYTKEINAIFEKNKKSTADLSDEQNIGSPALVFRTLLLRLVTIALSNDNTYVRDGEVLLKIYSYFVDQVLCHIDEFDDEQQIFSYFASKEHVEWMNEIGKVVLSVKMIHSHQDNITECLTTLKSLTRNIESMILAYLVLANEQCKWPVFSSLSMAPRIKSADLSDQFVEKKLHAYEVHLANKSQLKDSSNVGLIVRETGITTFAAIEHLGRKSETKSILDARDIYDNSQISVLVACQNNKCPAATYQKLVSLYNLYFKTRCLLIGLEQIDKLITTCSWVPLVMGTINLGQICSLMRIHADKCSDMLAIPNNDLITRLPFRQEILYKSFHAQAQLKEMRAKIAALEDIQNPSTIKKIKYEVASNISNLLEIQDALKIALLQYNQPQEAGTPLLEENSNSSLRIEELPTAAIENKPAPDWIPGESPMSSPGFFSLDQYLEEDDRLYVRTPGLSCV